jgi:hypothetical protein
LQLPFYVWHDAVRVLKRQVKSDNQDKEEKMFNKDKVSVLDEAINGVDRICEKIKRLL